MGRMIFLVGESLTNLRRNALVATGAILAVFISLTLAFGALVVNELLRLNTIGWQQGDPHHRLPQGSRPGRPGRRQPTGLPGRSGSLGGGGRQSTMWTRRAPMRSSRRYSPPVRN